MPTLKITKLDPKPECALGILNAQGKIAESIFPYTHFGKGAEATK
jgi:hypothetical protein